MINHNETVREVYDGATLTAERLDDQSRSMLIGYTARMLESHEREMDAKDAEIARLKAAMMPVIECRVVGWKIELGDELPRLDILANCHNAVREAQRIYKEGGN